MCYLCAYISPFSFPGLGCGGFLKQVLQFLIRNLEVFPGICNPSIIFWVCSRVSSWTCPEYFHSTQGKAPWSGSRTTSEAAVVFQALTWYWSTKSSKAKAGWNFNWQLNWGLYLSAQHPPFHNLKDSTPIHLLILSYSYLTESQYF